MGTTVDNGGSRAGSAVRTPHHHALSCGVGSVSGDIIVGGERSPPLLEINP
ncbi:MAG: hypothetical protein ACK55Z_18835 [bacterium]